MFPGRVGLAGSYHPVWTCRCGCRAVDAQRSSRETVAWYSCRHFALPWSQRDKGSRVRRIGWSQVALGGALAGGRGIPKWQPYFRRGPLTVYWHRLADVVSLQGFLVALPRLASALRLCSWIAWAWPQVEVFLWTREQGCIRSGGGLGGFGARCARSTRLSAWWLLAVVSLKTS